MTTTRTPTSGAADLRKAAQAVVDRWDTPLWKDVPATAEYIGRLRAALAAGQATAAQAVVQDDLITIRKPTTNAEMLLLLKLAHLVISDVDKTLEETFSPAQPLAEPAKSAAYAALPESFLEIPDVQDESGINAYYSREAVLECIDAALASHGQAPAGANENAKLVTLIAKCRDAFPIPDHGDPIENYWSAAIEDPANVPAYLQEIAKRKQADSVQDDSARLDWLLLRVSGAEFRRIGVHYSGNARRADVDAARKQGASHDR